MSQVTKYNNECHKLPNTTTYVTSCHISQQMSQVAIYLNKCHKLPYISTNVTSCHISQQMSQVAIYLNKCHKLPYISTNVNHLDDLNVRIFKQTNCTYYWTIWQFIWHKRPEWSRAAEEATLAVRDEVMADLRRWKYWSASRGSVASNLRVYIMTSLAKLSRRSGSGSELSLDTDDTEHDTQIRHRH